MKKLQILGAAAAASALTALAVLAGFATPRPTSSRPMLLPPSPGRRGRERR